MNHYKIHIPRTHSLDRIGAKAHGLLKLAAHGFNVPKAVLLDAAAVEDILGSRRELNSDETVALCKLLVDLPRAATLAVRSSGRVSMPGILITETGVSQRIPAILDAVRKVAASWFTDRAVSYRRTYRLAEKFDMGIVVQHYIAPVTGIYRSGVLLTRDPLTGAAAIRIETVPGPGAGLVDGRTAPDRSTEGLPMGKFEALARNLETVFKRPIDAEFVYDGQRIYVVQARPMRHLSPPAWLQVATDMMQQAILTTEEAGALLGATGGSKAPWWLKVDQQQAKPPFATGLGSVPGAFTGRLALHPPYDQHSIFGALTTEVDDAADMMTCGGILTGIGGITCHASMLARAAGIPAVVNAAFHLRDANSAVFHVSKHQQVVVEHGALLTIDGATGNVYRGRQPIVDSRPNV